jgi:hypothetical protein
MGELQTVNIYLATLKLPVWGAEQKNLTKHGNRTPEAHQRMHGGELWDISFPFSHQSCCRNRNYTQNPGPATFTRQKSAFGRPAS